MSPEPKTRPSPEPVARLSQTKRPPDILNVGTMSPSALKLTFVDEGERVSAPPWMSRLRPSAIPASVESSASVTLSPSSTRSVVPGRANEPFSVALSNAYVAVGQSARTNAPRAPSKRTKALEWMSKSPNVTFAPSVTRLPSPTARSPVPAAPPASVVEGPAVTRAACVGSFQLSSPVWDESSIAAK